MLRIHFGDLPNQIPSPKAELLQQNLAEWYDDPIVQQMIRDIDDTICYGIRNMSNSVLGSVNNTTLSGGVSSLILAYKLDNCIIRVDACGDNCAEWLLKLGQMKDITITLGHIMRFPEPFSIYCINLNKTLTSFKEYVHAFSESRRLIEKEMAKQRRSKK